MNERGAQRQRWILAALLALAVILTALFVIIVLSDAIPAWRGPAPWPPSWRWLYRPLGDTHLARQIAHVLLLLGYLLVTGWLLRPSERTRPRRSFALVTLATLFLFAWQLSQTWVREQSILDTVIFRVYAPPLNGYFVAPAQVESVRAVLNNYAASIPTFFADKAQTHPPGLFIFYALFNGLFERLPGLSAWFAPIARGWAIPGRDWTLLHDHLVTSAFVTGWLQIILASLAPVSLYLLLRRLTQRAHSADARDLALWAPVALPLLAPLTLFVLQWDANYLFVGFAAWFFAVRGQDRLHENARGIGRWLDWLWAGLLLSILLWLSYGMAWLIVLIVLHLLWREALRLPWRAGAKIAARQSIPFAGGLIVMGVGLALPWLLARLAWDMNFFELLRIGMARHYELVTAQRIYSEWLWMNLADFALWLGPATLLLGLAGSVWLWRRIRRGEAWQRDFAGMAAAYWLTLLLLNFSGSTRGEIGRLWTFMMPFPMIFAFVLPWSYRQRLLLLVLLAAVSWALGWALTPLECC